MVSIEFYKNNKFMGEFVDKSPFHLANNIYLGNYKKINSFLSNGIRTVVAITSNSDVYRFVEVQRNKTEVCRKKLNTSTQHDSDSRQPVFKDCISTLDLDSSNGSHIKSKTNKKKIDVVRSKGLIPEMPKLTEGERKKGARWIWIEKTKNGGSGRWEIRWDAKKNSKKNKKKRVLRENGLGQKKEHRPMQLPISDITKDAREALQNGSA